MTASLVMGESATCLTTSHAIIGIADALEKGRSLIIDNDWPAFRALEARGLVLLPGQGIELRVSEVDDRANNFIVAVRRPGSPDTFYAYRSSLECPKKPKAKKAR